MCTGGMLPLSATLATSAVFDAFSGDTKLQALLHGHSYAGNAIGCAVACEAYDIFSSPALNSNVHALPQLINQQVSDSAACQQDVRSTQNDDLQMRCLWDAELVKELSWHERVTRVVALGECITPYLPGPLCWCGSASMCDHPVEFKCSNIWSLTAMCALLMCRVFFLCCHVMCMCLYLGLLNPQTAQRFCVCRALDWLVNSNVPERCA